MARPFWHRVVAGIRVADRNSARSARRPPGGASGYRANPENCAQPSGDERKRGVGCGLKQTRRYQQIERAADVVGSRLLARLGVEKGIVDDPCAVAPWSRQS